jgi:hypothetical protein
MKTMQKVSITARARDARRAGGYYQVTEPGFGFTSSCEDCSRIIKLYPTDWGDYCAAAQSEASNFLTNDLAQRISDERISDDTNAIVRNLRSDDSTISSRGRRTVVYLVTEPPIVTLDDRRFTANDAGIYSLSPGFTLLPRGQPVTIDGTAIQLDCGTAAVVIGGSTSKIQPVTVAATSAIRFSGSGTRDGDMNLATHSASSDSIPRPPLSMNSPTNQAISMGNALKLLHEKTSDWTKALMLVMVAIGVYENLPV